MLKDSGVERDTESLVRLISGINLILIIVQFVLFSYLLGNTYSNSFHKFPEEVRLLLIVLPISSSYLLTYLSFFYKKGYFPKGILEFKFGKGPWIYFNDMRGYLIRKFIMIPLSIETMSLMGGLLSIKFATIPLLFLWMVYPISLSLLLIRKSSLYSEKIDTITNLFKELNEDIRKCRIIYADEEFLLKENYILKKSRSKIVVSKIDHIEYFGYAPPNRIFIEVNKNPVFFRCKDTKKAFKVLTKYLRDSEKDAEKAAYSYIYTLSITSKVRESLNIVLNLTAFFFTVSSFLVLFVV
ncbi:MAG: hypothetical protein ACTSWV_00890 [Candidatus Asgardarchaeia archaeon]